jgi:hypothetical protein
MTITQWKVLMNGREYPFNTFIDAFKFSLMFQGSTPYPA